MASQAFDRLEHQIYREYRSKGYAPSEARYIAQSTAGEIARAKHAHAAAVKTVHAARRQIQRSRKR